MKMSVLSALVALSCAYGSQTTYASPYSWSYDNDEDIDVYQDIYKGYRCFVKVPEQAYITSAAASSLHDWQRPYNSSRNETLNLCRNDGRDANFCEANLVCERVYETILIEEAN